MSKTPNGGPDVQISEIVKSLWRLDERVSKLEKVTPGAEGGLPKTCPHTSWTKWESTPGFIIDSGSQQRFCTVCGFSESKLT